MLIISGQFNFYADNNTYERKMNMDFRIEKFFYGPFLP